MRVQRIFVQGLFGRFDHEIRMNLHDRITIIHGPNGFGKTVLLRMIASLFSPANATLLSVPFGQLEIDFDNGSRISVMKVAKRKEERPERSLPNLRFTYSNGSERHDFTLRERHPEQLEFPVHMIDEMIPELERIEHGAWRHLPSGALLSLDEVVGKYWERFPGRTEELPEWLKTVRESVPVRLIQAERLQTSASPARLRHAKVSPNRAVILYSQELGAIIKQTLTEYAALSQSLDRSFPARAVTHSSPLSVEELQKALRDIEAKRARLVEAGLLGQEGEEPTVPQHIFDETKRAVLSVYVQDTLKKLSVFDQILAKVELFKNSINQRFVYQQISIGKEGFGFTTTEGGSLDPLSLSSGEQQEVVLLYELLFKAKENSLILIDEPEISLHVAWQEQFLSDLHAVTALSQFDVLIATHSPQIISDRWDLTVELKGPQDEVLAHSARHSE